MKDEMLRGQIMDNLSYSVKCIIVEFKCDDVGSELVVDVCSDAVGSFKRCRDEFVSDVVKRKKL